MEKSDLYKFLSLPANKLAVLASLSASGQPEAALVGIAATPELEIVFDTVNTSRKYKNIVANSAVAFVVGCHGDATLQFEGSARVLSGPELDSYKKHYFAAWPDGPSRQSWPAISYIAVKPKWIRMSDYGETPALIQEFRFD